MQPITPECLSKCGAEHDAESSTLPRGAETGMLRQDLARSRVHRGAKAHAAGGIAAADDWRAAQARRPRVLFLIDGLGWGGAARAAVLALGVSYFFTASTLLYLLARQSCDGQDYTDIWTPGETERLIEDALQARAAAGGPSEGATRLGARVSRPEPSETE